MRVQHIITWAALAVVIAGSSLAPNGQAEPGIPKVDRAALNAFYEVSGITIPDSKLARDVVEAIRNAEDDLLFQHSVRVYCWAALAGKRKGLTFDPELLYVAAMFHDYGL